MSLTSPERKGPPFVDVIVPVFNDSERLTRCLRALEEQSYPADQYQVLVIDNGSSEDITGVCRAFPRVRCLSEPRPGSYAARNKGIACSEGQILAFTDADCLPHLDWLEKGVTRLMAMPECGLVGGDVIVFPRDSTRRTAAELYESAFAFQQRRRVEESHWSVTANLFVRRSVFESVGPFDAGLLSGGDVEWGKRAHALGHQIMFAEDARVDHPARSSLGELMAKARRVAGGGRAATKRYDASNRNLLPYLARALFRSFRKTVRILAGDRFNYAGAQRFTLLERLKICVVLNLFTMRRLMEVVSLRLLNRPASRS